MQDILDPTTAAGAREKIAFVPRPRSLQGLRIGLVENTKKNSEQVLTKIADRLAAAHGMTAGVLLHKEQRAPLTAAQVEALKGRVDFALIGVGD